MFVVPKHIAHKMVITSTFVLQKSFINFQKFQPKTNQAKHLKNHKKHENFEPKNSLKRPFNLELRPSQQLQHSKHLKDY